MTQTTDISQEKAVEYWRNRAEKAEERCAEIGSELYTIQELLANPSLTDKEKVCSIAYFQWYKSMPASRNDGSKYFSLQQIAARMGGARTNPEKPSSKEQAFSPVHTKLKKAGLIITHSEPQKKNTGLPNYYDRLSPDFESSARSIALEKSASTSNHGGRRVALHRGCTGVCIERKTYSCTKCGHHVSEDEVMLIDAEKWDGWKKDQVPCIHCESPVLIGTNYCAACGGLQNELPEEETGDEEIQVNAETEASSPVYTSGREDEQIQKPFSDTIEDSVPSTPVEKKQDDYPDFTCYFCKKAGRKTSWNRHPEDGWICSNHQCVSPISSTINNNRLEAGWIQEDKTQSKNET